MKLKGTSNKKLRKLDQIQKNNKTGKQEKAVAERSCLKLM